MQQSREDLCKRVMEMVVVKDVAGYNDGAAEQTEWKGCGGGKCARVLISIYSRAIRFRSLDGWLFLLLLASHFPYPIVNEKARSFVRD